MLDPTTIHSIETYRQGIHACNGSLAVPRNMSYGEAEWEFLVSKLHWKYQQSTPEHLATLKKIVAEL